ncbi:MAG: ABC transporter ATP-binding protein, partial [Deltaproteobacteria bacterium]|nr:ABC transporter ATP-binding protein [Deltaproteobacteria bacterium]
MTILSADNISFSYGKMPVLRDISLAVQAGEWIGLLGPNGSGKTTLIKCF